MRLTTLAFDCPDCAVRAGQRCTSLAGGRGHRTNLLSHPRRLALLAAARHEERAAAARSRARRTPIEERTTRP